MASLVRTGTGMLIVSGGIGMYRKIEIGLAVALLTAIVILVGAASVARVMGSPIIWSIEISQLLFLWLCMLAADIAMQQGRHFGLTMLIDKLAPGRRRLLIGFNMLVLAVLLAFLLLQAWKNTMLMHSRLDGALQIPGSYFHAAMVVGLALMLRTTLVQFYDHLRGRTLVSDGKDLV